MRLNCEYFNRNDEVCFIETEVKVYPLTSSLLSRPIANELSLWLSESMVTLKTFMEFERKLLISKYEYLLRHRVEHPEAYKKQGGEDKGN